MSSPAEAGITPRHWIALTALPALVVGSYLHLYKLGLTGPLACTADGGCEVAQFSSYGAFLGVDVALIGTIGFLLIFLAALVGVQSRWSSDRRVTQLLALLVYPALLFTLRLKYGEFVVLKTFCVWCAFLTAMIVLHGVLVWLDWRRVKKLDDG